MNSIARSVYAFGKQFLLGVVLDDRFVLNERQGREPVDRVSLVRLRVARVGGPLAGDVHSVALVLPSDNLRVKRPHVVRIGQTEIGSEPVSGRQEFRSVAEVPFPHHGGLIAAITE